MDIEKHSGRGNRNPTKKHRFCMPCQTQIATMTSSKSSVQCHSRIRSVPMKKLTRHIKIPSKRLAAPSSFQGLHLYLLAGCPAIPVAFCTRLSEPRFWPQCTWAFWHITGSSGILALYSSTLPCTWWFPCILVEKAMVQMVAKCIF